MRLLLDTCAFVWLTSALDQLSPALQSSVNDSATELFLSDCSVWEVGLKWQSSQATQAVG